jgi:hypothetical protein
LIKTAETESFVIYDDVMDEDQFSMIWKAVQSDDYAIPHISGWSKVWRATDGTTMGSRPYENSEHPFNNYMDLMYFYMSNAAKSNKNILDSWNALTLRSYIYPRGTKLSWHNDVGYKAAAIFYVHPEWSGTWGGELMIANTPPDANFFPPHLDHREEDRFLETYGMGTYITCKPNRLVLTKGGVWHSINRVDPDAGDHCRCSVVGFFK